MISKIQRYREKLTTLLHPRRIFFALLCICFILLYLLNSFRRDEHLEIIDARRETELILDTAGCKIPKLDPYDHSVKHLIRQREPYACGGDPAFMVTLPNATITVNETVLNEAYKIPFRDLSCFYNPIYRTKDSRERGISFGNLTKLKFGVPLEHEFIKVQCDLGSKTFTQYVPLVPIKPEVEKRASKAREKTDTDSLNVILIGIDSVSKLNFLRHFKRTHRFLVSKMSAFDMKGYTKVGDNTFPNLVPLLTGHFVEHYWNETLRNVMTFDHLDFVWKAYSERGYRTFYAEDSPYSGTFNYLKKGFKNPPTDYYYRTMALAVENSDLKKQSSNYCLNDQLEIDIIYRYLKDFARTMEDRPYFAFAMVSTMTHDYVNEAGYVDEPTYRLLSDLWADGAMNKSIVVVFSDHGIRFGQIRETYIGKFEERMPFMYVSLPGWFLEKHEDMSRSIKTNRNRLITLFDVHATLYHLLNPTKAGKESATSKFTPNGLSLLAEITEYRTCELAKILPHWCTCQVHQYVSTNDVTVVKAAAALMYTINDQLKPFEDVCARLEVSEITDAMIRQANDMVLSFVKTENVVVNRYVVYGNKVSTISDYLVTIRAGPGEGMFEGTVRHDIKTNSFKVMGISRINMYGQQSRCIDSQILKKFCFCQ